MATDKPTKVIFAKHRYVSTPKWEGDDGHSTCSRCNLVKYRAFQEGWGLSVTFAKYDERGNKTYPPVKHGMTMKEQREDRLQWTEPPCEQSWEEFTAAQKEETA